MAGMTETLKLIISGDGKQLRSSLATSERDIRSWGGRVQRNIAGIHSKLNAGLKRAIVNPISGLLVGGGIVALGKQIVDFDGKLMRLGINGNISGEALAKMRAEIIDTAIATGQSREDVLAGINAIVERTGNIKFADEVKKQLAITATATGASVEDIGALASNLNEKLKIDSSGLMEAMNVLDVQGKAGAFTLENMASMGERLFSALGNLGGSGIDELKKFGALIQVARTGTGSSEQATTAVERILSNIIQKQDQIKKLGFDVIKNRDLKQFKSVDELIKGIITASKGDQKILGDIFGEEGIKGVSALAKLYRETGGFKIYDELVSADAQRAGEILRDFDRYSTSSAYQFSRLIETGKKFADISLSKPLASLTESMKKLDPSKMQEYEEMFRNLGDVVNATGSFLMFAASGWSKLIGLLNKGTETYGRNQAIETQWNLIPKAEQKKLTKEFLGPKLHDWNYMDAKAAAVQKYFNSINLSVHIDGSGGVRVTGNDLNTNVKTSVFNRGEHRAAQ